MNTAISGLKSTFRLAAGFSLLVVSAFGAAIGSVRTSGWGFAESGALPDQLWFRFTTSPDPTWGCWTNSPPACYELFSRTLTPADIGSTFSVNSGNNPDFASIAALLTNGVDNEFNFSGRLSGPVADPGGAVGIRESLFFPPGGGPDFLGSIITQVDLTLNNLTFGPVSLPSLLDFTPAIYTQAILDVTVTVEGVALPEVGSLMMAVEGVAIPEISSGGMTLLGLLLAAAFLQRRRSRSAHTPSE